MTIWTILYLRAARYLRDVLLGWYWAHKLAHRQVRKVWYPFRDAPWWVVREFVCPGEDFRDHPDIAELVNWARIESGNRLIHRRFNP